MKCSFFISGWLWTNIEIISNCLSESFTLFQDRPLASGHLEKLLNGVRKNRVKYFASGVHKEYGYQKMNQNIKSSLMGVYDRFTLQSFDLLNVGTQFIKASQSFGFLDGVFNSLSLQSLKSKALPLKDILCYPKG